MGGAIDHPLLDQFCPNRAEAGDLDAEGCGDVAGTMGTGAKFGHGPQIIFFTGSETVESDPEEVGVETGDDLDGSVPDVSQGNG